MTNRRLIYLAPERLQDGRVRVVAAREEGSLEDGTLALLEPREVTLGPDDPDYDEAQHELWYNQLSDERERAGSREPVLPVRYPDGTIHVEWDWHIKSERFGTMDVRGARKFRPGDPEYDDYAEHVRWLDARPGSRDGRVRQEYLRAEDVEAEGSPPEAER